MTDTLTGGQLDVEVLNALDFEPELPCEAPRHEGGVPPPGRFLIQVKPCPICKGGGEQLILCEPCWKSVQEGMRQGQVALCVTCGCVCGTLFSMIVSVTDLKGGA